MHMGNLMIQIISLQAENEKLRAQLVELEAAKVTEALPPQTNN